MTPEDTARLYRAMKDGDRETFQRLLRNAGGRFERSGAGPVAAPLVSAVFCERIEFLEALLAAGAEVDFRDESVKGSSYRLRALEAAHWFDREDMVELLERHGAAADFGTALFRGEADAVDSAINETPSLLDEAYIHPHFSLLHVAAEVDSAALVRVLVKHGLDPNVNDGDGHGPLRYAARNEPSLEVCEALLAAGAGVNAKSKTGITALTAACRHEESLPTIELLLSHGADPNLVPSNRVSALMKAAGNRSAPMVKLLLRAGADRSYCGKAGETALDVARRRKAGDVESLLDARA